ncbi:TPA: hypothetical protein ACULF1_004761 [Escherichia coli]|nr:hypothetical protein [Escherichia coli]MCV8467523.1 hypothetical protein [Escherichia coli]MCV8650718.1 hypothetical protein [Escherichia coli]
MEKLDVMDASGEAVSWIVRNQDILLGYAVNRKRQRSTVLTLIYW